MPTFKNGEVEIAYLDQGEGDPIVLVHGFASNKEVNWVQPGWVSTLTRDNRRVIALDNRGHGQSTKLYDPADYHTDLMAGDVAALIAHLGLGRADVMGYSLGARICAVLAARHPERVRSVILGGAGIRLIDNAGLRSDVAAALEAPSIDGVTDPMGKAFRLFAEQTKSDLRALAACLRGSRQALRLDEIQAIRAPALVAVGTKDDIAGSPHELAALIPHGAGARHSGPRSHGRGRRSRLQGGRARVPARAEVTGGRPGRACGGGGGGARGASFRSEPSFSRVRSSSRHVQPATAMFKGAAGNRLVADVFGDAGQPVLLLHGGGQTRHAWRRTAEHLARAGAMAYALDQRGHGDSEWVADGSYAFTDFAADAAAVAATLSERTGKHPIAIGASLGGIASLLAEGAAERAGSGPLFAAIVLVDITPRVESRAALPRSRASCASAPAEGFATVAEAADAVAAYLPHRKRPRSLEGLRKNLRLHPDGRWRWHWDPRVVAGRALVRHRSPHSRSRADRGREGDHDSGAAGARRLIRTGAGGACARVPRTGAACRLHRRGGGAPHGGGRPTTAFPTRCWILLAGSTPRPSITFRGATDHLLSCTRRS